MHDLIVDRNAERRGKTAIAFERRFGALAHERIRRDAVELRRCDARLERRLQELECVHYDGVRLVHLLELFVGATTNHARSFVEVRRLVSLSKTASTVPRPSMAETLSL